MEEEYQLQSLKKEFDVVMKMSKTLFTSKNITIMIVFGVLSALITLTTSFIPAPIPGLYGLIAVPIGTIFILTARELIGKIGAATFTQLVSGFLSTFLPGGPPIPFIIIPTWVLGGIVIDIYFYFVHNIKSRKIYGIAGLIYNIPGDFLLFYAFTIFLRWPWSFYFFLYSFVAIHAILGCMAGLFMPDIIHKIKPSTSKFFCADNK